MELDIFNPSRHIRRIVLFWLSMLLAIFTSLFSYLSFMIDQHFILALVQLIFACISTYVCYQSYKQDCSFSLAIVYCLASIIVVGIATFIRPLNYGVYVWACLFPILFYLVLNKKQSTTAASFALAIQLFVLSMKEQSNDGYIHIQLLVNFVLCYLCIWLAAHMLEAKRQTSEISLGQLASRDALTGVHNRLALIHNFERYRQESATLPLSLLVLDLDFFKDVNDRYGHTTGDRVLVQTAALIDSFTDEHLVYRIGGEEFCIALHNTNIMQARIKAEQIRIAIEENVFNHSETPISLTASIGIYQCDHFKSLEEVLDIADKQLYRAKNNGRNQVMVCNSEQDKLACSQINY
ncbi:GGDEF domain-containing protein [Vibrio sinensis]|uniref:diguanylate cyclase n=1 Tax=Vibrio sinensis TaxID=2302434 RepID=A0A3A6QD80_9VIBR|nr:GGDEF domain-containing protein [Vibrio sinensis]RJX65759.1 GGDEF domain-containing protein [Vibrio sinensis]